MPPNDLRVELRTRNNLLWHLVFDDFPNVSQFCKAHGLQETVVGGLLNLSFSPYKRRGVSPCANALARIAGMLVEDLFPKDLYSGAIPQRLIAEIPSSAYRGLGTAQHVALPATQDVEVSQRETRETLEAVLKTLTPREEYILKMRYGLSGQDECSAVEIGQAFGVSRTRISQLEIKALRKLRHPERVKMLTSAWESCK